MMKPAAFLLALALLAPAAIPPSGGNLATVTSGELTRSLRVGGVTAAVNGFVVRVPQIPGQSQQFTLLAIASSGEEVKPGDLLAQFDDTTEAQNARDAKAKYDDFSHQVDNQIAQNRSSAEQRASDLQQAESDLGKAQLELKKAPILSSIDAQTDQANLDDATAHVASLKREDAFKDQADAATLRGLELQRDQQQVEMQRALNAVAKLRLTAPIGGMVGLVAIFRGDNGQGPAQPGDQIYSGNSLVRIFDPEHMAVDANINEADGATLAPGLTGVLHLDAYPGTSFPVHVTTVSPVAVSTGPGLPVRQFGVNFLVDASDPRLLPDLTASIDLVLHDRGLLVPRAAIHFSNGEPMVTVPGAGGAWREQPVELGSFNDQQVIVTAGVHAGEQLRLPEPGDTP